MKFHYKCLHLERQSLPTTHINLTASIMVEPVRYGLQLFKSNTFRNANADTDTNANTDANANANANAWASSIPLASTLLRRGNELLSKTPFHAGRVIIIARLLY